MEYKCLICHEPPYRCGKFKMFAMQKLSWGIVHAIIEILHVGNMYTIWQVEDNVIT